MSTPTQTASADSEWAMLASAEPAAASIGTVLEAREDQVTGADLVSLIVASEKALSLLQARQATLLAEFARPSRAGDVSALVAAYTEGFDPLTRRPDGEIDTDVLQLSSTSMPGALAGHGAVTADLARAIAASLASINTVIVDPASGAPVPFGETVYRHSQDISDKAITAAGTCRFPSCRQPAWHGDLDHRTAHARGRACAGG